MLLYFGGQFRRVQSMSVNLAKGDGSWELQSHRNRRKVAVMSDRRNNHLMLSSDRPVVAGQCQGI